MQIILIQRIVTIQLLSFFKVIQNSQKIYWNYVQSCSAKTLFFNFLENTKENNLYNQPENKLYKKLLC